MTKPSEGFIFREEDRNCRLFGPYCQFLSLFSTSVLSLVSPFLLMLLCVVTPRPAIRHHRCLICSYSWEPCLSPYSPYILLSFSLFLPQESPVTSSAPSGTSRNKQPRDSNVIRTVKMKIDTRGSRKSHWQWNASLVCTLQGCNTLLIKTWNMCLCVFACVRAFKICVPQMDLIKQRWSPYSPNSPSLLPQAIAPPTFPSHPGGSSGSLFCCGVDRNQYLPISACMKSVSLITELAAWQLIHSA